MARHWRITGQTDRRLLEQIAVSRDDAISVGAALVAGGAEFVRASPIYRGDTRNTEIIEFTAAGYTSSKRPTSGFPWGIAARRR